MQNRDGFRGADLEGRAPFFKTTFFVINLKNYKLCYLKLN